MTGQPDQILWDARDVLRDVLRWSLTPDRWAEISAILDGLGTRLDLTDSGQLAALARATVALELAGPERLTPIGTLAAPVPDSVRERVNVLVHQLLPPAQQGADETSRPAG